MTVTPQREAARGQASAPRRAAAYAAFLTAGGLVAAFGAALCCGLPLLLVGLGLGSLWLIEAAPFVAPYRTVLLMTAALLLAGGAALLWRSRRYTCAADAACANPAVQSATVTGLLAGVLLLYLGYAYA